jgi:hypothetical protein
LYLNSPYYVVPDSEVGQQAFSVPADFRAHAGMMERLQRMLPFAVDGFDVSSLDVKNISADTDLK